MPKVGEIYFFKEKNFFYKVSEVKKTCIYVEMPGVKRGEIMWIGRGKLPISMAKEFDNAYIVTEDEVSKRLVNK